MLKEDYVLIAKKLAKSGSLRVNNFYGTLTVLAEIACLVVEFAVLLHILVSLT